jgi:hypothetical protein
MLFKSKQQKSKKYTMQNSVSIYTKFYAPADPYLLAVSQGNIKESSLKNKQMKLQNQLHICGKESTNRSVPSYQSHACTKVHQSEYTHFLFIFVSVKMLSIAQIIQHRMLG